jgi:hypothetical protein
MSATQKPSATRRLATVLVVLAMLALPALAAAPAGAVGGMPTVDNVNPNGGVTGGGTTVVITGTNFEGAQQPVGSVKFDTTAAASYTVDSDTQITAVSPAHAAGVVEIIVTTPVGTSATGTGKDQFTYVAFTPTVSAIDVDHGKQAGGTTVTLTGTGFFGPHPVVKFGTNPATSVTITSDTQLTATSPAATTPGVVDITVTTDAGTSPTSSADQFTYYGPPTITKVDPNSGRTDQSTSVVITGTGFVDVDQVRFGAIDAASFTVDSKTQITAASPSNQSASTVHITVRAMGVTNTAATSDQFQYVAPTPAPTISGVNPTAGPATGGTSVTITGDFFTGANSVKFGATEAASFTVTDQQHISATSPAHPAGQVHITVTTGGGGPSANGSTDQFTFIAQQPTVSNVSPSSGGADGGTTVTVTGTHLLFATSVKFGTVEGTNISNNTDTSLTVTSPAQATGQVHVTVTTGGGTSNATGQDQYTYIPKVTSLSPTGGPPAGGTSVVIAGAGFNGATAVTFGSTAAASFSVDSDTQITAVSPAQGGEPSIVDVTVTVPAGTSATSSADRWKWASAPTVTGRTPTAGTANGGTPVTITGTSFTGATAVKFGGTAATSYTVDSDTQITAVSPAHAAGVVDIVVSAAGDSATSSADQFTYVGGRPVVTSVSPTAGPTAGGTTVTVTGSNFNGASGVSFGSTAATAFTVNSDTSITATSPAHAAAIVDITVSGPGGTSATTSGDRFIYFGGQPAVSSVTPNLGPPAGGTSVTIAGTNLTGASAVAFGATAATSFTVDSDTQITAVSPAHGAGVVDITVTAPGGTSAKLSGDQFSFRPDGYWLVASDGGIFNYGSVAFYGSTGATKLNKPVVGMAAAPVGSGYWLVASDGGIFNYGGAGFFGSTGATTLNKPIVGMAATPSGKGYWLVASDGGIFNYGDAGFFGSAGASKLNQPIVGMAATPSGKGYWLVASDGGIFNYGDAPFLGSTGGTKLNKPIVGMAGTPSGAGYWLVASDGGIFNYGNAAFRGSAGGSPLNKPVVGMAAASSGKGYWLVASDGGIFNYGDVAFLGSAGGSKLNQPVVGIAAVGG